MIHYHIYHVPNFEEHKQKIIDLINKIPSNPLNDGDKISHQDYEISKDSNKEYQEYFQHKTSFPTYI